MRRLLNTMFVTTQGTYLSRERETVLARKGKEHLFDVPIHTLEGIVCFGRVACSTYLMGLCAERGVALSFVSRSGRLRARVVGGTSGNVLLRREQYRRADDVEHSKEISRAVVVGKVANCRSVILRCLRDRSEEEGTGELGQAVSHLGRILTDLRAVETQEEIRGKEGEAAKIYFSVFDHLILSDDGGFRFEKRSRRPPLNAVNALLSFLYTLLMHDISAALESVGLDPAVGFLHRDRPGRNGLALDLMEELRPIFADRLALSLINRRQVKSTEFDVSESGAVWMSDATRKTVLVARQKRSREELLHPFIKERIELGLVPYVQALLFARFLRGDLDGYPPFAWR